MENRKKIWESALIPGLILGAIPAVCTLISGFMEGWQPQGGGAAILKTAVSMSIWIAKVAGCFVVFRTYMQMFSERNQSEGGALLRFGIVTALLSAVIFSGFYLAYVSYICPDSLDAAVQVFRQQFFSKVDAATRDSFEEMIPNLPRMMFFGNLVYCFCYGTVLSVIFTSKFKR